MKYRIIFVTIFFSLVIILDVYKSNVEAQKQQRLVRDLKLQLNGVVRKNRVINQCKGNGILEVDIIESNISDYDKRGYEPYFCFISCGKAIFYVYSLNVNVGDTIFVDTDSTYTYNSKGEISFSNVYAKENSGFWERFKTLDK